MEKYLREKVCVELGLEQYDDWKETTFEQLVIKLDTGILTGLLANWLRADLEVVVSSQVATLEENDTRGFVSFINKLEEKLEFKGNFALGETFQDIESCLQLLKFTKT